MSQLESGQYYGRVSSRREQESVAVACLEHRQGRRLPLHVHRQAYFSMTLAGGYREETGRRAIEYRPLTMVYHPPGTAHVDEIGPRGARFLTIEVGDALVAGDGLPDTLRSGYPVELPAESGRIAFRALDPDRSVVESAALELISMTDSTDKIASGRPRWLEVALERARDEFRSPPATSELAALAGVHPVHFARVVRRETGTTLARIVRRRRVEHAVDLLSRDETLCAIALECGFADQSHFNRSFLAETGLRPGEMKQLLRG